MDLAKAMRDAVRPLFAKVQALEQKVGSVEKGGDIAVLTKTLSARVVPEFDSNGKLIGAHRENTDDTVRKLEKRIEALEQRESSIRYRGVWDESGGYRENEFATYDGSLWACKRTGTHDRPATSGDWQLCVRKGRAGKDAR